MKKVQRILAIIGIIVLLWAYGFVYRLIKKNFGNGQENDAPKP